MARRNEMTVATSVPERMEAASVSSEPSERAKSAAAKLAALSVEDRAELFEALSERFCLCCGEELDADSLCPEGCLDE